MLIATSGVFVERVPRKLSNKHSSFFWRPHSLRMLLILLDITNKVLSHSVFVILAKVQWNEKKRLESCL